MRQQKRYVIMVGIIVLLVCSPKAVSNAADPTAISISKYTFQTTGITGDMKYVNGGDDLQIQLDTQGKEKGYYSATAFQEGPRNIGKYGGYSFKVTNQSKQAIRLNAAVNTVKDEVIIVKNGASVILNQNGTVSYRRVDNDCFELPASFKGVITIPYYNLVNQKTQKTVDTLANIYGFGFMFVLQENASNIVTISDMHLIEKEYIPTKHQVAAVQINGSRSMLRPTQGTSVEYYTVSACDMTGKSVKVNASLALLKPYDGVSLSGTGKIEVDEDVVDDVIVLEASYLDGITIRKKVYLEYSWTEHTKTANGYNASVAKTSEVAPLIHSGNPLMSKRLMVGIRSAAIVVFVGLAVHYLWKRKKYKNRFRQEEEDAIFK